MECEGRRDETWQQGLCDVLQSLIVRLDCLSALCEVNSGHGAAKACAGAAEVSGRIGRKVSMVLRL
jgi:hypothetical protein